jgi:methylenetetrahydrofolate dehydrogenase (NADP+)/methenyltetrahydrofolate cyclohydrolase
MAALLLKESCTVSIVHSRTQNIRDICKNADILVAAVGRPKMIDASYLKPGAVVIDVGLTAFRKTAKTVWSEMSIMTMRCLWSKPSRLFRVVSVP